MDCTVRMARSSSSAPRELSWARATTKGLTWQRGVWYLVIVHDTTVLMGVDMWLFSGVD